MQGWTRVGSTHGSGRDCCKFRRVGSRNLNIFIHVFRKLQNFARTEKLSCEFDLFSNCFHFTMTSPLAGRVEILKIPAGRVGSGQVGSSTGRVESAKSDPRPTLRRPRHDVDNFAALPKLIDKRSQMLGTTLFLLATSNPQNKQTFTGRTIAEIWFRKSRPRPQSKRIYGYKLHEGTVFHSVLCLQSVKATYNFFNSLANLEAGFKLEIRRPFDSLS
jgi:hypothetical protein